MEFEKENPVLKRFLAEADLYKQGWTVNRKKNVQTLRPLQQITVHIAGYVHGAADPPTSTANTIAVSLDLRPR